METRGQFSIIPCVSDKLRIPVCHYRLPAVRPLMRPPTRRLMRLHAASWVIMGAHEPSHGCPWGLMSQLMSRRRPHQVQFFVTARVNLIFVWIGRIFRESWNITERMLYAAMPASSDAGLERVAFHILGACSSVVCKCHHAVFEVESCWKFSCGTWVV